MKRYIKDGVAKYASEIVITKDGMTTTNPTEEMILADGWVEYIEPEPTPAPEKTEEEKLAILLGTEGNGLAKETIARSDYTVMIPMSHGVDSLNVAAASAVAFWEMGKGI